MGEEQDSSEIEARLIKAAEERSQDISGMALSTYRQLQPRFMAGLHRISSKGRIRLLKALVDYPINPGKYQLNDIEKELLEVGSMVLESKFILIMNTYAENIGALVDAAESEEVNLTEQEKSELTIMEEEYGKVD